MDQWFISWCVYTLSEAGGFNVEKYGSSVKGYSSEMTSEQVFIAAEETLREYLQTEHVQITGFNRV